MVDLLQTPRGTQDILPKDQPYWRLVERTVEKKLEQVGFGRIDTPIFEYPSVFIRSLGESTDIVQKEMFSVSKFEPAKPPKRKNDGDEKSTYILRPENTASIVRAYIQNGLFQEPQPVKLWYFGPMFRCDRPQKGRYRQFWQWGFEIFGDDSPATDALTIQLVWNIFEALKLTKDLVVEINTLGDKNCRPRLKKTLTSYFEKYAKHLSDDGKRQLKTNPLRILDSKDEKDQQIIASAPQIVDFVCDVCKKNFTQTLEHLDDLGIAYDLNSRLVRGLDYYTGTTFEVRESQDTARQSALGGGGRYNDLAAQLGGKPTSGIGFSAGVERIIEALKQKQIKVTALPGPQIYIVQIGATARRKALLLFSRIQKLGYRVNAGFAKDSLKGQLRTADKLGAKIALIIGQREAFDGEVIVKDLDESSQETIKIERLDKVLAKKLKK